MVELFHDLTEPRRPSRVPFCHIHLHLRQPCRPAPGGDLRWWPPDRGWRLALAERGVRRAWSVRRPRRLPHLQPFLGLNPYQTLPAISITGQPANPTNNAHPAFTVSAEEGATLACSLTPSGGGQTPSRRAASRRAIVISPTAAIRSRCRPPMRPATSAWHPTRLPSTPRRRR